MSHTQPTSSSWRREFLKYLRARKEAPPPEGSLESLRTHTTELFRMFNEGLFGFGVLRYVSPTQRELKFLDGRTYVITIEAVRGGGRTGERDERKSP